MRIKAGAFLIHWFIHEKRPGIERKKEDKKGHFVVYMQDAYIDFFFTRKPQNQNLRHQQFFSFQN